MLRSRWWWWWLLSHGSDGRCCCIVCCVILHLPMVVVAAFSLHSSSSLWELGFGRKLKTRHAFWSHALSRLGGFYIGSIFLEAHRTAGALELGSMWRRKKNVMWVLCGVDDLWWVCESHWVQFSDEKETYFCIVCCVIYIFLWWQRFSFTLGRVSAIVRYLGVGNLFCVSEWGRLEYNKSLRALRSHRLGGIFA